MRILLSRSILGLWALGAMLLVLWGTALYGQAAGGYSTFAPLIARNVTTTPNDYVGMALVGLGDGSEIYTFRADGSDIQRLTFNEREERSPVLSRRGDKIAFWQRVSGTPGEYPDIGQVMVMNRDGSNVRPLGAPRDFLETGSLQWSPDGSYLLAAAGIPYIHSLITVADGSEIIFDDILDRNWTATNWSPDGQYFYYIDLDDRSALWTYHIATGVSTRLGDTLQRPDNYTPTVLWHPNHAEILVNGPDEKIRALLPDGSPPRIIATGDYETAGWLEGGDSILLYDNFTFSGAEKLYKVPFAGGDITKLVVPDPPHDGVKVATISPSGDAIVYWQRTTPPAPRNPIVYHRLGQEPLTLIACAEIYAHCSVDGGGSWSNNGRALIFTHAKQTTGHGYEYDTVYVQLGTPLSIQSIDDSIQGPSFLPGSSIYATGYVVEAERELYLMNLPDSTRTRLVPELGNYVNLLEWRYVGSASP